MEEEKTNEPQSGLWASLPTEEKERMPKITFDINVTEDLTFISEPTEMPGEKGVYYQFDVIDHKDKNIQKIIQTSAWTLLKGLKVYSPLNNTRLLITKRIEKGKQLFEVKKNEVQN